MEKNYWLLLALLAFALPVVGCSDDEDEEELVGNWVKVSDFDGVARCSAVTFTVGGKVYVAAGGYGGYKYRLNDLWAFNEDSGTWTQVASMEGVARTYAVGFSTELYGYVGLGYDGDNYLKDFWRYDEGSDKWEQITSIGGSKRIGASSFVIDDIAYVVGGENNSSVVTDFWSFDPVSGTWTEKREISNVSDEEYDDDYSTIPRSYGVAFTMYGLGYFTCGENAGSGRSNTWEYNPSDDTWTERSSFEGGTRTEAVGFSINNKGYVLTGKSGTAQYDDMWEFFPQDEYNEND